MADGTVNVPNTGTASIDVESLTVGGSPVSRQRMVLAGASALEVARVLSSAPAGTEYALVTRNIPSGTQTVSGTVTSNVGTTGGLALDSSIAALNLAQASTTSGQTGPLIQGAVTTAAPTYTTGKTSPLSLTTAGALRIDGSGITQPVSGTITANAGSGTFTVAGTVTANIGTSGSLALDATLTGGTQKTKLVDSGGTNVATVSAAGALKTDGSAVTQPVSGTITANIGTSGSLALDASVTGLQVAQGSTTSGQKGGLILGAVTTAAPTYTTAQSNPLSLTTGGLLRVDGSGVTQPVSGTVTANAGSGTFTVAGTITANIGTSGSLALDATLTGGTQKTKLVDSGGTNVATVSAGGALKVDGSAVTQPVSGTITANIGTSGSLALDATLTARLGTLGQKTMANSTPVVLASDQAAIPVTIAAGTDRTSTGTITTTQNVAISTQASGSCGIQVTGIWTGTLVFEATVDGGTTWNSVEAESPTTGLGVTATAANGVWIVACAGYAQIRVRGNTVASGTATVFLDSSTATQVVILGDPLPTGSNTIGKLDQGTGGASAWKVDGSAVTQPVSGTITANIGTSGSLALDATLTGGTQKTKLVDSGGTNVATVSAAGALKTDGSAVTQPVSGTITANIGTSGSLALDATLAKLTIAQGAALGANTQALTGGSVTTAAPTYTTGQISPLSLTTAGALRTDGSGATQPVSGTVTANAGTGTFTTSDAHTLASPLGVRLSDGAAGYDAAKTGQLPAALDGSGFLKVHEQGTATVAGTVTANIGTSGSLALDASVTGLQVAQGSTTTAQKGSLIMGAVTTALPSYTTAQTSPLSLTTQGLLRTDGSGVTQPVSGAVTANIGTSGSLALDATLTGGTQKTKLVDTGGTNVASVNASGALLIIGGDTAPAAAVLGALNAASALTMAGQQTASMHLAAGTLIGTIVPEVSFDGGTTYVATYFDDPATGTKSGSIVFASSNTVTDRTIVGAGGASHVRVRVSAFTSGTANCAVRGSMANDPSTLFTAPAGVAAPTIATVGGQDAAGLTQPTRINANKALIISGGLSDKVTYCVAVTGQANTASSDAIAIEAGSAKKIYLRQLVITNPGNQTTAGFRNIQVIRTTTAGSAGTVTPSPLDSADAAFSGIARAKPTSQGTGGTVICTIPVWVPAAAAAATPMIISFDSTSFKSIVVPTGTTNGIAIRDPGATGGANFAAYVIFTEE